MSIKIELEFHNVNDCIPAGYMDLIRVIELDHLDTTYNIDNTKIDNYYLVDFAHTIKDDISEEHKSVRGHMGHRVTHWAELPVDTLYRLGLEKDREEDIDEL